MAGSLSGMERIEIAGWGAVSPAGWGAEKLTAVLSGEREAPAPEPFAREGAEDRPLRVRRVPAPVDKLPFLREPRLRRASPIARFCVGAALEAMGPDRVEAVKSGGLRLGTIFTLVNGCINYSGRFYGEVLADPALASPIVFPETVYNAPASHLGALLGSHEPNATLVGDSAQFLNGLDIAARWLLDDFCDAVVVVGGEEFDWLSAEAFELFEPGVIHAEGAGALLLRRSDSPKVELGAVAEPVLHESHPARGRDPGGGGRNARIAGLDPTGLGR